mgnify:FL=1
MADDEVLEDEPTELDLLTEISNDIKYLIKCTVPNSVYVDFEFPETEWE